jgi:hypothetical protein
MEFLTFEPGEFQVLEDIEFDETIQRPEAIRFFTLSEQTVDAFDRMIPKGRTTRFQLNQVKAKVDRFKDLYTTYIVPTEETYLTREASYGKTLPWVFPIKASEERRGYDFLTRWAPLFADPTVPNFYTRMLTALPKPYQDVSTGAPYYINKATEFLDETGNNPYRTLPVYSLTRTQVHEDRSIDVIPVPVQGTEDNLHFKGYYLAKRPLEVPNPLADHPFLKSSASSTVETTSALVDVLPSIDAILTHAVPVTSDPYGKGLEYLKIYDVDIADIPWRSWKSRFPPVEVISVVPSMLEIPYPKVDERAPSEKLESVYKSKFEPGLSPRYWLMDQVDGGQLVVEMLRSQTNNSGNMEIRPGADMGVTTFPPVELNDPACNIMSTTFAEFITKGLIRREPSGSYSCVPLDIIKQERANLGYQNRVAWKEGTPNEIMKRHLMVLASASYPQVKGKVVPENKTPMKEEAPLRLEILAVIADPQRVREDKYRDAKELLMNTQLSNHIHTDVEGRFVLCEHIGAILGGDLEQDRKTFYDVWSVVEGGFRVCKFCGEHINNDVVLNQDEYDEDGFKIKSSDVLEARAGNTDAVNAYTTGLSALQPLFDLDQPMDSTAFLLLSILRVLPSPEILGSLLAVCRGVVSDKFPPVDNQATREGKGSVGIALVIILLQIHIPTLIPPRSFGSQPLRLTGFPRDEDTPGDYSIVDSMLYVLRKTFEAYPTSFKGPSAAVVRAILSNPKKIKQQVSFLAGTEIKKRQNIKDELVRAAEYVKSQPASSEQQVKSLVPVVAPPKELGVITRYDPCPSERPILTTGGSPKFVQGPLVFDTRLFPSRNRVSIQPSVSVRVEVAPVQKKEVTEQLRKKPKEFPISKGPLTNLTVASRLADAFLQPIPLRRLDPSESADVLRDACLGYLYQELNQIQSSAAKNNRLEQMKTTDVALYTLTAVYTEQKKEVNKLRAKERLTLVERLARKSDQERQDISELLQIGLAPYIMTNQDRVLFAREAERLSEQVRADATREETQKDEDTGVGLPRDFFDQGEGDADRGDYGDYYNQPGTDGRDADQPGLGDDGNTAI